MPRNQPEDDDFDPYEGYDSNDEPTFQALKKQTNKPQTIKTQRKQAGKEWGRAIHKIQRSRRRSGKP